MSELEGKLIAISVSDAPDRSRLGFPQREIDRALMSLCTVLVRAGAAVAYAGSLDPDGYTFKIFRHLAGAYAGSQTLPFFHFIPEPVARRTRFEDLYAALNEGRGILRTEIARGDAFFPARPSGHSIRVGVDSLSDDAALAYWLDREPAVPDAQAYSRAREMVTARADARVILGGKMGVLGDSRDAYEGAMPGIAEEAIMTLRADKPLIVLGAYGGVSRDIAIALELLDPADRVPRTSQSESYEPALRQVADLKHRIPLVRRDALREVADSDRSEQTAHRVATLIEDWLRT